MLPPCVHVGPDPKTLLPRFLLRLLVPCPSPSPRKRSFRPAVEALDGRDLPSSVPATPVPTPHATPSMRQEDTLSKIDSIMRSLEEEQAKQAERAARAQRELENKELIDRIKAFDAQRRKELQMQEIGRKLLDSLLHHLHQHHPHHSRPPHPTFTPIPTVTPTFVPSFTPTFTTGSTSGPSVSIGFDDNA